MGTFQTFRQLRHLVSLPLDSFSRDDWRDLRSGADELLKEYDRVYAGLNELQLQARVLGPLQVESHDRLVKLEEAMQENDRLLERVRGLEGALDAVLDTLKHVQAARRG